MGFGNLKSDSGLQSLNSYLQDCSYIEGFVPSQADVAVFKCLAGAPPAKFNHALRWYNHIASHSAQEQKAFPGVQKPVEEYGSKAGATNGPAAAEKDDEDDNFDLFGSDDEEDEVRFPPFGRVS
jgi:elongation factor 1-beta